MCRGSHPSERKWDGLYLYSATVGLLIAVETGSSRQVPRGVNADIPLDLLTSGVRYTKKKKGGVM
jgi:hypothetical protein